MIEEDGPRYVVDAEDEHAITQGWWVCRVHSDPHGRRVSYALFHKRDTWSRRGIEYGQTDRCTRRVEERLSEACEFETHVEFLERQPRRDSAKAAAEFEARWEADSSARLARVKAEAEALVPGSSALVARLKAEAEALAPLYNDHDGNGVCRKYQVPSDHPIFQEWKTSFSPCQVEELAAERRNPHRIEDGRCLNCGHDAGKPSWQVWEEKDHPEKLLREHNMGQHQAPRAKCPECEPQIKARQSERETAQAAWHAIHGSEDHSCPECQEDKRLWVLEELSREHWQRKHSVKVPECESCERELESELERQRELSAHTSGEHQDFDYRDKDANTLCSECRKNQWDWYERQRLTGIS